MFPLSFWRVRFSLASTYYNKPKTLSTYMVIHLLLWVSAKRHDEVKNFRLFSYRLDSLIGRFALARRRIQVRVHVKKKQSNALREIDSVSKLLWLWDLTRYTGPNVNSPVRQIQIVLRICVRDTNIIDKRPDFQISNFLRNVLVNLVALAEIRLDYLSAHFVFLFCG